MAEFGVGNVSNQSLWNVEKKPLKPEDGAHTGGAYLSFEQTHGVGWFADAVKNC